MEKITSLKKEKSSLEREVNDLETEVKNIEEKHKIKGYRSSYEYKNYVVVLAGLAWWGAGGLLPRGGGQVVHILLGFAILFFVSVFYQVACQFPERKKRMERDANNKRKKIRNKRNKIRTIEEKINKFKIEKETKRKNKKWWTSMSPKKFEREVAKMYEEEGYDTNTTEPSNDGGYDIEMESRDGSTCLVECKKWEPGSNVGRPIIQKLVGAVIGENADYGIVVTTSDFTEGAKKYAKEAGVRLINGGELTGR